jgi:hypothetical protein
VLTRRPNGNALTAINLTAKMTKEISFVTATTHTSVKLSIPLEKQVKNGKRSTKSGRRNV